MHLALKQNTSGAVVKKKYVRLPLRSFHLLNQSNTFAKILRKHIKLLSISKKDDLNDLAILCQTSKRVKEQITVISIDQPISLKEFEEILRHFPNIWELKITLDPKNYKDHLAAISHINKLHYLYLDFSVPEKEKTESEGTIKEFLNHFLTSKSEPTISPQIPCYFNTHLKDKGINTMVNGREIGAWCIDYSDHSLQTKEDH
jgi:hypothetical protein